MVQPVKTLAKPDGPDSQDPHDRKRESIYTIDLWPPLGLVSHSVSKGTHSQAWQPYFDPQNPYNGRREPIPRKFPLTSACVLSASLSVSPTHTHKMNEWIIFRKGQITLILTKCLQDAGASSSILEIKRFSKPGFTFSAGLAQGGTKSCLKSHHQKDQSPNQPGSDVSSLLPPNPASPQPW